MLFEESNSYKVIIISLLGIYILEELSLFRFLNFKKTFKVSNIFIFFLQVVFCIFQFLRCQIQIRIRNFLY